MSKERLEEIINDLPYSNRYEGSTESLIEYAREQAERVQELEEEKKALGDLIEKSARISWNIEQQNKRYRELVEIIKEINRKQRHDITYTQSEALLDISIEIRKAEEGENHE